MWGARAANGFLVRVARFLVDRVKSLAGFERNCMRNIDSLKTTEEFSGIYRQHHSCADRRIVMYQAEGTGRIGIVCSKKVGNSVVRHRFARLVREVYRQQKDHICKDKDIIVVAREMACESGFTEIRDSFLYLLRKNGIYVE